MIKYENDCVGCPQGCINCGRKSVEHYYCDECKDEIDPDEIYGYGDIDDEIFCRDCFLEKYRIKF